MIPEVTRYGALFASVALTQRTRGLVWLSARGKREDLLDDAFRGSSVRLDWLPYEGGSRLYLDPEHVHVPAARRRWPGRP